MLYFPTLWVGLGWCWGWGCGLAGGVHGGAVAVPALATVFQRTRTCSWCSFHPESHSFDRANRRCS